MDEVLRKAIRHGFIGGSITAAFSFFYGGIYTEMIVEGLGITIENLIIAFLGAVFVGCIIFMPVFVISLIISYFRNQV